MPDELAIFLTDVPVRLRLGVPRAERERDQIVLVSIAIARRSPPPYGVTARLQDTIDYAPLITFLKEELPTRGPFLLAETVAETVLAFTLNRAGADARVSVEVKKPSVLNGDGMASVKLARGGSAW
jgi:dihydroneopterin aldolase